MSFRDYIESVKKVWKTPSTGFGDTVYKITSALRIPHCDGCERRRKLFNEKLKYRMKRKQPMAFVMPFFPCIGDKHYVVRILFPGWGRLNGAICLETELDGVKTAEDAENLLDEMVKALKNIEREPRCDENVGTRIEAATEKEDEEENDRYKRILASFAEKPFKIPEETMAAMEESIKKENESPEKPKEKK